MSKKVQYVHSYPNQPSDPAAETGRTVVYSKVEGLFARLASGTIHALTIEPYVFAVTGVLTVQTGKSRIYMEAAYAVESIRAAVSTAPTGAAIVVDVSKNGTTMFTTQSNRPTIAAGGFLSTGATPDVTTFAAGDYMTVDVDQIGSTIAGSDLTVTIRLRRI